MENKNSLFKYINILFKDPTARVPWLMLGGAMMNLMYIASNAASAILYHSLWATTLTAYHLVLMVIRLYLLFQSRINSGDRATHRICLRVGILLLALDVASAVMMFYSVSRQSFASYSGFILLGFLCFTVYSVARSVIDIKKHREGENRLYFAARNISLSTSLMSVFNLQYSVFSLLGAEFLLTGRVVTLSGVVVFSVILILSLRLIKIGHQGGKI